MLAFSVWNAIWVVFVAFLWISVLIVFFNVIVDVFRDKEMKGATKAIWVIVLLLLPFIGLLIYVIARGDGMAQRQMEARIEAQETVDAYVRNVAASSGGGAASELEKAAALHADGKISDDEYAALKSQIIGG